MSKKYITPAADDGKEEVNGNETPGVSRIFGKGASQLVFDPVQSSTPTREESKRNNSIGSDEHLEADLDSSKKLRLDFSPGKDPPKSTDVGSMGDLSPNGEDTGGGGSSPLPVLAKDDKASRLDSNVQFAGAGSYSDPVSLACGSTNQEEVPAEGSVIDGNDSPSKAAAQDLGTLVQQEHLNISGEGPIKHSS